MTDLKFRKIVGVPVGAEWPKKLTFTMDAMNHPLAIVQTVESRLKSLGYQYTSQHRHHPEAGILTMVFVRDAELTPPDPSVLLRKAIDQFESERDETHALGTLLPATEELITQIRAWLGD